MTIHGIKCKKCGDIIYSRANHDFRWCSCHSVAVDGGQNGFGSITGSAKNWEFIKVEVNTTLKYLYDDWNTGRNKFGLIKVNNIE